jgi:protein TonB
MYSGKEALEITLAEQELIVMEEITQTRQEQPPPPPPRPPVPVEVPDDVILDDDVLNLDATLDLDEFITDLPPPPPPSVEEEEEEEPEIFIVVEQPPVLVGTLADYMKQVKYPEMARKAEIEGRVTVEYVVDEQGNVTDPVVLRGIGAGCDQEALRVVSLMKFEPGRQRGRPVKVRMATGVNFRLSN